MFFNTLVGPQNFADGAQPVARSGKQADTIVSELHGRFYEQNYRGNVFSDGRTLTALTANTITLTATTTPILGVWNPVSSSVNVVILQAALEMAANNLTSGAAPGAFVWAVSLNNAIITTGNIPYNRKSLAQAGSQAKGMSNVALTGLTNNLVIMEGADFASPSGLTYTTLASTALMPGYVGVQNFDGGLIVPPGGVLALLNTTSSTVFSCAGRLMWEEVPV
jgi:hypothetical protein